MTSTQFCSGGPGRMTRPGTPENSPLAEKLPLWDVLVFDRNSRAEHIARVGAVDADEAEVLAHHEAVEDDPSARVHVKAVGLSARPMLWSVWLRGRLGLREVLPAKEPLLLGRVVAVDVPRARLAALAAFGNTGLAVPNAPSWRWLQQGDHFVVTQC
ncbi:MAG: hypothetical protein WBH52_12205 [Pseudomonas aeruginosa]